jgi:hypothetical protein
MVSEVSVHGHLSWYFWACGEAENHGECLVKYLMVFKKHRETGGRARDKL